MSTIILLIIVMIAVAVGLVFLFMNFGQGEEQTDAYINIGKQGSEIGVSTIDETLFKIECDKRCVVAKSISKSITKEEACDGITPAIEKSHFCDNIFEKDNKNYRCDTFYESISKTDPCSIKFKSDGTTQGNILTSLSCNTNGDEKC